MTTSESTIPRSPEVAEEIERLRTFARLFAAYHGALAREVPNPLNIKGLRSPLSQEAFSLLKQLSGTDHVLLEDIAELIEPSEQGTNHKG